jgi:hypothetical protein
MSSALGRGGKDIRDLCAARFHYDEEENNRVDGWGGKGKGAT